MLGESVGNFEVVRQLGRGGMGEVWLAEHKNLKTSVAIKILLAKCSEDTQQVQRFFNEAIAVSKIKHAGIVRIFDSGFRESGEAYLVMEFLEGESLATRIARKRRLPVGELSEIARQIASVLEATHAAGITHRDLKPDNIFLVPDAEMPRGERVKILDFGIAKLGAASPLTGTSGTMGTPYYMSPEQWRNSAKVDARADVYSLGCLTFEMATGRPPFTATSVGEACAAHLSDPPPDARSLVASVPPELDRLLGRLLAKLPEDRPTMRDVKLEVAAIGERAPAMDALAPTLDAHPVEKKVPTTLSAGAAVTVPQTAPRKRRTPVYVITAGVVLVVLGGAGTYMLQRGTDPEPASNVTAAKPDDRAPSPALAPTDSQPVAASPPDAWVQPSVTIHVEGTPGVEVFDLHDVSLGSVPGDVHVPRGKEPVELRFRRAGFDQKVTQVTPIEDQKLTIVLDPTKPRRSSPGARPQGASAPAAEKSKMPDEIPSF